PPCAQTLAPPAPAPLERVFVSTSTRPRDPGAARAPPCADGTDGAGGHGSRQLADGSAAAQPSAAVSPAAPAPTTRPSASTVSMTWSISAVSAIATTSAVAAVSAPPAAIRAPRFLTGRSPGAPAAAAARAAPAGRPPA